MRLLTFALLLLLVSPSVAQHANSLAASSRGHMDVAVIPEEEVVLSVDVYSRWNRRNGLAQFRIFAIPTVKTGNLTEEDRAQLGRTI